MTGIPGMRPMRVVEVSGSAAGGVRAHLGQCSRALSAADHEVIVAAPTEVLEGLDTGIARRAVLGIGPRPALSDRSAVRRLAAIARGADVVHAHGLRAGSVAALALGRRRRGRARLVVTLHNLPVGGRLTRLVGDRLESLVARRADVVLGVSPDLVERARARGAAGARLAIIPAPEEAVGDADGHHGAGDRGTAEALAGAGGGPIILTVARLAPQKGLDLLLDAASILARRAEGDGAPLVWLVAGEGPERPALQARIDTERLPVTLLGRREDARALMASADAVVQTSLWEGQPLTIQEALRAGAAIIATDVGGTGITARGGAILVAPEARAIADAIGRLLNDPAARREWKNRARAAATGLPTSVDLLAQLSAVLSPGA
ncbi:Glycosyltransferase involved in cell wall bisynthesis [Actinomyces denticolens]|uniref:Glycosyltransferase involved in cell wall bisynthesis n=1 Tax=Actinomyces denticolens TaxID=52767 RepID=A0ABY1IEC4_9ACTO|nr:glycosyltransferase [Actinomyces denticolens]SHJ04536.1 Glycosyltransferase involved in cell wall bisynthesis [Actinomyces denticolens]